jgi:hypothetical protein
VKVRSQTAAALRSLASSEPIDLLVTGDCMSPLLRSGERIRVRGARAYLPGDVIVFRRRDGRLLVHRVLGYAYDRLQGLSVIAKGDQLSREDDPVGLASVVGRVIESDDGVFATPARQRWQSTIEFLRTMLRRSARTWTSVTSS